MFPHTLARTRNALAAALLALVLVPAPSPAATAVNLAGFEGREEPTVLYDARSGTFTRDEYPNMTDQGDGIVRFELRYRSGQWWDGDRSTTNRDRQRAEVKGLGPHQKANETFEYITTWRTNPEFAGSGRFCHFFQLKATDGDNGAPLVVASIFSGQRNAAVRYWPGDADTFIVARNFNWSPATWQNLKVVITTSNEGSPTGEVRASVDGDALAGITGVPVYRPGSTDYRPKWGLYRGVTDGLTTIGDDYVEHRNVTVNKISTDPPPPGIRYEAERIPVVGFGATTAVQNDARNSGGRWMALLADGPGDSVEYTLENVPAGTYDLWMKYKSHPSRGILEMHFDGVPIGPPALDQYSNPPAYPEIPLGTVRFAAAGDHIVRQTALGKNPASASHTLSADVFILLPDKVPPVIEVPDDITAEATGPSGAVVHFSARAVDDKDGEVPVVLTPASGSTFPLGETTVTAAAIDSMGNRATDTFVVTVVDTTPPTLVPPADITIRKCRVPNIGQAAATDLVDTPTITNDAPELFGLGVTIVTWRAVDGAGNAATATQRVTAELGDDPSCCPAGTRVIVGTAGTDVLLGTAGNDCILCLGGNDVVNALGGDDLISGGAGNDTIAAGDGHDVVWGGSGDDTIDSGHGNDRVYGGPGRDVIFPGLGSDTVDGGPDHDVCAAVPDGIDSVSGCP